MGEPGHIKAYGVDLRWRMVWQRLVNSCTIKEVAASLLLKLQYGELLTDSNVLEMYLLVWPPHGSTAFMNMMSICLLSWYVKPICSSA